MAIFIPLVCTVSILDISQESILDIFMIYPVNSVGFLGSYPII